MICLLIGFPGSLFATHADYAPQIQAIRDRNLGEHQVFVVKRTTEFCVSKSGDPSFCDRAIKFTGGRHHSFIVIAPEFGAPFHHRGLGPREDGGFLDTAWTDHTAEDLSRPDVEILTAQSFLSRHDDTIFDVERIVELTSNPTISQGRFFFQTRCDTALKKLLESTLLEDVAALP